jgi:hypothetical protein
LPTARRTAAAQSFSQGKWMAAELASAVAELHADDHQSGRREVPSPVCT